LEGDLVRFEDGLHAGCGGDDVRGAGSKRGIEEEPRVVLELLEADGSGHGRQGGEGLYRTGLVFSFGMLPEDYYPARLQAMSVCHGRSMDSDVVV